MVEQAIAVETSEACGAASRPAADGARACAEGRAGMGKAEGASGAEAWWSGTRLRAIGRLQGRCP